MVRRLFLMLAVPLVISSGCALSKAEKNRAIYHNQMGQSFYAENNFTSALQEFSEAEKLTPKDPLLLNDLGLTYFRKGRYDLAEAKYLKAIDLKPDYSEARNNLGVDYLEMKRWDDAIAQFKMVQNDIFYSGQESAAINLGLAYLGKGEYPEALRELRGAVSKNPNNPRCRLDLGRVYFAMGKTDLAIEQYRKALALNNSYAAAHYNLGLALMKQKQNQAARESFKEVLRITPDTEMGQLSREYLDLIK